MKKITINDIAGLAGVSKSTVSRYLNNKDISDSTKEKIKTIIDEYGYEPNAFAQSLRAKKTYFIGIIAPCLDSFVKSKIMMAIDEELKELKYTSLIINTSRKIRSEIDSISKLARLKVDGINSIVNDDYGAGYKMGQYIATKGYKNIVYLGVDESDISVGSNRKNGVLNGLKDKGYDAKVFYTDFDQETSIQKSGEMLENENPDMIICATDTIAIATMKEINKRGKNIPQDISVAGFGGYDVLSIISPKLTTIKFENESAGKVAANTIVNLIQERKEPLLKEIKFELIEGESTINKN
ncbi:TPA: LacI family DNA-binding transcriptional regulator [Clostridioides difficile]|nr:LacI family DNA-binding transcriptional regulator [Clostridioides difficile]